MGADFNFKALGCHTQSGEMLLVEAETTRREYTIKALAKRPPSAQSVQARRELLRNEQMLLGHLGASYSTYVPLALALFEDEAYVYSVYKTKIVTDLDELVNRVKIDEGTAC